MGEAGAPRGPAGPTVTLVTEGRAPAMLQTPVVGSAPCADGKASERGVAMRDAVRSLQALPLFAQLTVPELDELGDLLEERSFDRHEVITREGALWDALYVVTSGKVKLTKDVSARSAARQLTIAVLGPGDPLNMAPLFEGDRNVFTAEALTRATLYCLEGSRARAFVCGHPPLQKALLRALNQELRRLVSLASRLAFTGVTSRLAFWMCEQTQAHGVRTGEGTAIRRDLTLNDMASLVGTARRVISRSLTDLQQDGVIEMRPTEIVILNEKKLEAIAGGRRCGDRPGDGAARRGAGARRRSRSAAPAR